MPSLATIATSLGEWPFVLNDRAMSDVQSRLTGSNAYAIVADMRHDQTNRAHGPRFALFIQAGIAEGRGADLDTETAVRLTKALGYDAARAIIIQHAPEGPATGSALIQ